MNERNYNLLFFPKLKRNMVILGNNVRMFYPGEPLDESVNGTVKIALVGSDSYEPGGAYDWQGKFAEGLAKIADPVGGTGLLMYKNMNFTILNCKPATPPKSPIMDLNNPEMVTKVSATLDFCSVADAVFLNFLKKSTSTMPIFELGYLSRTGKVVVRCPNEYAYKPLVELVCSRHGIPMFPGQMTTVLTILQALFTLPNLQQIQQYPLPE